MKISTRRILIPAIVVALCFAAFVQAQTPRRGRPRMSQRETVAAWTLQATHVAGTLALSEEQTAKLVDAYKQVRETSLREKIEEARENIDPADREARSRAIREAREEVAKAEMAKIEKALSGLDEEKVKKAVAQLGTFSSEWDRMVRIVAGLKLGDKQAKALELVTAYIVDYTAARNEASASGDREATRRLRQELSTELEDGLKAILSEKQMAFWNDMTSRRGRGGQ